MNPNLPGNETNPAHELPKNKLPKNDLPGIDNIEPEKEFTTNEELQDHKAANGLDETLNYIRDNKEALLTYIALLAGFMFLILGDFFVGSLIIGLTAGYHFSHEIVFYLRNLNHIFEGHEHLRFLVLTAVIVGFCFSIPGIFIGAIIAAVFKYVIYDKP